jgi:predicted house-cleaning NTP pyrophosphatase (Maf/HAM1 superfamily)
MIRYIAEYNSKNENLNQNKWWENFQSPNYPTSPVKFGFVSSLFINQYANQLTYIRTRTGANGCALTAETLIRKVDSVLGNINGYDLNEFFNDIGCNALVV